MRHWRRSRQVGATVFSGQPAKTPDQKVASPRCSTQRCEHVAEGGSGLVLVPGKQRKSGDVTALTMLHVPEHGQRIAHERQRRGAFGRPLGAILGSESREVAHHDQGTPKL